MYLLDDLDRGLVHALRIDGRAPMSRIAEVLGVSTQTVGRRYRRLRAQAKLRVVGLPDPAQDGLARWLVRVSATPNAAQQLANAMATRVDTSWVKLTSGGTEIVAIVQAQANQDQQHALLLRDIPRSSGITAVSAHYLLHSYLGGPTAWGASTSALDAAQQRGLKRADQDGTAAALADSDRPLLAALAVDGRASHVDLAAATGWSVGTVARRLTELRAGGCLFFDVEVAATGFGALTEVMLWLAVPPAHLDTVATRLTGHQELAFVAATTGPTNLAAVALAADPAALHRYLTQRLGALPEIHSVETAPVLRIVKAASPHRLANG